MTHCFNLRYSIALAEHCIGMIEGRVAYFGTSAGKLASGITRAAEEVVASAVGAAPSNSMVGGPGIRLGGLNRRQYSLEKDKGM